MAAVLGELGLSRLADIPALTAVGAAAILAETGDPRRYDSSSSLVKHAGLSPSDNASGAFYGEAHISRRGRPGLRLAVWRAVWPMLRFNPVLAAKYAAMTKAADGAAEAAAIQADTDHGRPRQRVPRPARGAPRPGSRAPPRCCAGSTPWSSTAQAGTPTCSGLGSLHLPGGGRLTSASIAPPLLRGALRPSSPMRGERARMAVGDNPADNPGQLSPGRPELLTNSVERCRGRPARITRARRARLHYVEREDPGDGRQNRAAGHPSSRRGSSPCPQSDPGSRPPAAAGTHQGQT